MEPWCSCWIARPIRSVKSERGEAGWTDGWMKGTFVQIELLVHGIWRLEGQIISGILIVCEGNPGECLMGT